MGLFDLKTGDDLIEIHDGLKMYEEAKAQGEALLIDVRDPEEYAEGHIPGSINIPADDIERLDNMVDDLETPLFLYCETGQRSARAAIRLEYLDFLSITNIGGIDDYRGKIEK